MKERVLARTLEDLRPFLAGYQMTGVILTAHQLGVFTRIGNGRLTAAAVARRIRCSLRGTTILLDAAAAVGLLAKRGRLYSNSPAARRWLNEGSGDYKGAILGHMLQTRASWLLLTEAVRAGRSTLVGRKNPVLDEPEANRNFILAMHAFGYDLARLLARRVDFGGVRRLLDLGGGPGSYSAALCEAYPLIEEAVVVDLPRTLKIARENLKRFRVADRISLRAADYHTAPPSRFGRDYDAAILSNILHAASQQQCVALLAKAARALKSGGLIVINEFLLHPDRTSPVSGAIFAVNMLAASAAGNSYTQGEIKGWLRRTGYRNPRTVDLDGIHVATIALNGGPQGQPSNRD